jgi:hypothetical protein
LSTQLATAGTKIESAGGRPLAPADFYSSDYFSARKRFLAAAARLGFDLHSLPIDAPSPTAEPLSIDVAVAGSQRPTSAILVSSGVHGVEGFFGSAVQLAFLDRLPDRWRPPAGAALVMIHALNPFGFAWQRRFNEDNVDLNRNFLLPNEAYAGSPPLSGKFRTAMLPLGASRVFGAGMAMLAARHGLGSFWETLPVGQYDFPDWLFFGGHARTQSAVAIDRFLPTLLDGAQEAVHLDLHTGLGRWGRCQLLLPDSGGPPTADWWRRYFDGTSVRYTRTARGSYRVRGGFGAWLKARLPHCCYRFATAEFGTYTATRVIHELVKELRWHSSLGPQAADHPARRRLTETFVPRSRRWRTRTLEKGTTLIRRAVEVVCGGEGSQH